MTAKRIIVTETAGVARHGEWVRVGLPFAKGELADTAALALLDPAGSTQSLQAAVLNRWSDGSVKWAVLDFAASVAAGRQAEYLLKKVEGTNTLQPDCAISLSQGPEQWLVDTGTACFSIDTTTYRPFSHITIDGKDLLHESSNVLFVNADGLKSDAIIDTLTVETAGPLHAILQVNGYLVAGKASFSSRLHFSAGSSRVMIDFTLLNPQSAQHPGGLWDLGDPGSLLFQELAFDLHLAPELTKDRVCLPEPAAEAIQAVGDTALHIRQVSSGGEKWQSPTHLNREGKVPYSICGYELSSGDSVVCRGKRATPVIRCGLAERGVAVALPHFWQEFPSAMAADSAGLKISLFPACRTDLHELQGGEQKTRSICFDFAALSADMTWAVAPLKVHAATDVYQHAGVISDLPFLSDGQSDLVDGFIPDPDVFFGKREVIDEYGWRNFGEVYADHEAVNYTGDGSFISHYNNQYDLCGGLYRKFMATGDPAWGELAADLARHVLDIDIYHTDDDREEYNRGLFWHTDHYIDAGLSTHRTYSREHLKIKDPRFCGGGPGAEHCYTTGLMIHYFQTGDPAFRDTVIRLADWVYCSLAGPFTILAAMKRSMRSLSRLRQTSGTSRPLFPRYPLTRGTGNTITACLDAYEVGGGIRFLQRAEELIRGTLHPDDDISARDLLNAETAWSYTVLLVAVAKFLDKKRELEQFDAGYSYARASLLAYAEWMLLHEYPYLEKPEILEYPNETWAAQDLRKCVIFYHAARHASSERCEAFAERGRYFFSAATEELKRHPSSRFTRPVALMLQNGWVGSRFEHEITSLRHDKLPVSAGPPTPFLGIGSVAARIVGDMYNAARVTSLKREMAWLKARLG